MRRDWGQLAQRVVLWAAAVTGAVLALGMVLSYAGLRAFFISSGYPAWAATLAPLTVDLLAALGYVGLLVLTGKVYPGAIVAGTVAGSAAAQGYHLSHGGITATVDDWQIVFAAGAAPMLCAGLAGHLLWLILSRALPAEFITAMTAEPAPVIATQEAVDLFAERDRLPAGPDGQPWRTPTDAELTAELHELAVERPPAALPAAAPDPDRAPVKATVAPGPKTTQHSRAAALGRPPSQETGPCDDACTHHAGDVGKSTRYRCVQTLAGRARTCPTCAKATDTAAPKGAIRT